MSEPERIIAAAIERHAKGDPVALAHAILNELWEAGYDVRPRPDVIPIRGAPLPHYTAADERRAADNAQAPGEMFRQLAAEPRNEPIRDKIEEIARKLD